MHPSDPPRGISDERNNSSSNPLLDNSICTPQFVDKTSGGSVPSRKSTTTGHERTAYERKRNESMVRGHDVDVCFDSGQRRISDTTPVGSLRVGSTDLL